MAMEGKQMNIDLDSTLEFISPDGQDRLLPLDTMECTKCGNVNKEFQAATPKPKTKIKTNKDGKDS